MVPKNVTSYSAEVDKELLGVKRPLLYGLICDASFSMTIKNVNGISPLQCVNNVLPLLAAELSAQEQADILPALIRFGGTVDLLRKFGTITDFQVPDIVARTGSPLGAAVTRMIDEIDAVKGFMTDNGLTRILRPVIIVYTDGTPTDEWESVAARTAELVRQKRLTLIMGAVGDKRFLNKRILSAFTGTPDLVFDVLPEQLDVFIQITSTLVTAGSKGEFDTIKQIVSGALAPKQEKANLGPTEAIKQINKHQEVQRQKEYKPMNDVW